MENKTYRLKIHAVDRGTFEAIKSGKKKIETRAWTENYGKIKKGDAIIFACGKKSVRKIVYKAGAHKSIADLFRHYKVKDIFPAFASIGEARKAYYGFPNYRDKIKKRGLIAWKLK